MRSLLLLPQAEVSGVLIPSVEPLEVEDSCEYSDVWMAIRYTTEGALRGPCGHKHKTLESAVECLNSDNSICEARGGHTDRKILAIGPGVKRELNAEERAAVAAYRATRDGDH